MTHELGPQARALLDAAREGLGPDAAAIHRMRAAIDAALDASIAAGGATGAGASAGAGTGTGTLAVKLGVFAAVAAIAVAVVAVVASRGEEAIEPRVELPAVRPEVATKAPSPEAAAPARPEPEIEMAPLVRAGEVKPPPRAAEPPRTERAAAPAPAPAPRRADLAREVTLVDQAMAALRGGNPSAALAAVRVHLAETGGAGQLAEDAAAIEIEALCRLHDPHVGAKLAAFDARWPASAQRSRLTTKCP